MTFVFVAQGSLPIPPVGWGAVEHIIWEYTKRLRAQGHTVHIVNEKWRKASLTVARLVRTQKVDVVHVHQERALRWIVPLVGRRAFVVATSHAPLDQHGGSPQAIQDLLLAPAHMPLHEGVAQIVRRHRPGAKVAILRNGTSTEDFVHYEEGDGKAVCLGKIQKRKRQSELARALRGTGTHCEFVGPVGDEDLLPEDQALKQGEWDRNKINAELGRYSALVLVSHAEGQPLAVAEGLAAGLCVVVSPQAAENLDPDLPFVFRVDDPSQWPNAVREAIKANATHREAAREYARVRFGYGPIVEGYVRTLKTWCDPSTS